MSRLGHLEQAYQITQWYPKPAVYDRDGWHAFPYLDIGEFYSEYGSFEVSITVPENYVVGATGELQSQEQLNELIELAETTAAIPSFNTSDKAFPTSATTTKTLVYKESNIHDFAWFADKRFHVLKGEVQLPNSGRTVHTWAYFPNHNAELWQDAIEYLNDAVYYYSLWYGDYPYTNCSAVHAPGSRGGMEYPNITIIGNNSTPMALETVIMHEVGHNWFYGILGSNERDHPWMDEGLNTFSEMRYFNTKYPDNKLYPFQLKKESQAEFLGIEEHPYPYIHQMLYRVQARRNLDLPITSCSEDLVGTNYSAIAYSKTGLSFYYLKVYLGEDTFNSIMQQYFETWKFKHPTPTDLQKLFEDHVDEDLSWFFDDLLRTDKKLEYKISKARRDKILIKNKGQLQSPVLVNQHRGDSTLQSTWVQGFEGKQWVILDLDIDADRVSIFGYTYPDLEPDNNSARLNGLARTMESLRIQPFGAIEDPNRTTLNLLPAIGWNYHNGVMLGGYLYNDILPLNGFEYSLMPMYSLGSNEFAGLGELRHNFLVQNSIISRISPFIRARQFSYDESPGSYYQKLNPGVIVRFKRKVNSLPVDNEIQLDYIHATDMSAHMDDERSYVRLHVRQTNREIVSPHQIELMAEMSDGYTKASIDLSYKHTYIYKNSLDIRFFAGAFLNRSSATPSLFNFYSGGTAGLNDYTYDGLYLGRALDPTSELFVSNQFTRDEGGFVTFNPLANSEEYLVSLNVSSSLPIAKNIPIQFYVNAALLGERGLSTEILRDEEPYLYEAGVKLQVIRNLLEFYFPLFASEELQDYLEATTDTYLQQVRFTFNIDRLNMHDLARELK
ncbi:MAG: M1 family metallopeptidase [Flavobacteriales bacterium]|nr:M1 family metallopeptidase [Flavobacteriales bacterium]